jgi:hypothetical protein
MINLPMQIPHIPMLLTMPGYPADNSSPGICTLYLAWYASTGKMIAMLYYSVRRNGKTALTKTRGPGIITGKQYLFKSFQIISRLDYNIINNIRIIFVIVWDYWLPPVLLTGNHHETFHY